MNVGKAWFLSLLISLLCLAPMQVTRGVVTSDVVGSHIVEPGGTAFGTDLTGVASIGFSLPLDVGLPSVILPLCTASLITDRHILTAAHCLDGFLDSPDDGELQPPDGQVDDLFFETPFVARFETSNGDVRIPLDLTMASFLPGWPTADADMAIVELAQSPPAEIPRYPIYAGRDEVGKEVVVTGFGSTGHGATGENPAFDLEPPFVIEHKKRAGLNRFEEIGLDFSDTVEALLFDFDSGLPENNTLSLLDVESDLGFGEDEVGIGSGDSGGPVLFNGAIIGLTIAQQSLPDVGDATQRNDGSWGELSVALRISNYRDFINEATNGQAVFVPEPGTGWMWFVGIVWLLGLHQGKRRFARV